MANEGLQLKATATVKLLKYDDKGNLIGSEKHTVELTKEEAQAIWHSQQQA